MEKDEVLGIGIFLASILTPIFYTRAFLVAPWWWGFSIPEFSLILGILAIMAWIHGNRARRLLLYS
jgi:hypothetical protein